MLFGLVAGCEATAAVDRKDESLNVRIIQNYVRSRQGQSTEAATAISGRGSGSHQRQRQQGPFEVIESALSI